MKEKSNPRGIQNHGFEDSHLETLCFINVMNFAGVINFFLTYLVPNEFILTCEIMKNKAFQNTTF